MQKDSKKIDLSEATSTPGISARLGLSAGAHHNALKISQEFVANFAKEHGVSADQLLNIELIVEEVVSNIVKCAYPADHQVDDCPLCIECAMTPEELSVTFTDTGVAFNPLEVSAPNLDLTIEDREIGGLGIFLVKSLAKKVEYTRCGIQNRLTVWISKSPS